MKCDKCGRDFEGEEKHFHQRGSQRLIKCDPTQDDEPQICPQCSGQQSTRCQLCGSTLNMNDLFCGGCVGKHSYY